jgi:hypothetical protein
MPPLDVPTAGSTTTPSFRSAYDLRASSKADFRSGFGSLSIGAFPILTLCRKFRLHVNFYAYKSYNIMKKHLTDGIDSLEHYSDSCPGIQRKNHYSFEFILHEDIPSIRTGASS